MAILNPKYDFLKADYANPNLTSRSIKTVAPTESMSKNWTVTKVLTATGPALLLTVPNVALASDFDSIYPSIMRVFDSGVVLVIVFAGAAWALGHRSKAIELLIGVCCGYLLARHGIEIRDYLKTI